MCPNNLWYITLLCDVMMSCCHDTRRKSDQKTRKSQKVKCYKLLEYLMVKYYKLLEYLMVMCNKALLQSICWYSGSAAIWFLNIPFKIIGQKTFHFFYNPFNANFRLVPCTWLLSGETPFCYLLSLKILVWAGCQCIWIQYGALLCSSLPLYSPPSLPSLVLQSSPPHS